MFCENCGHTLPDTAAHCKFCGQTTGTPAVSHVGEPKDAVLHIPGGPRTQAPTYIALPDQHQNANAGLDKRTLGIVLAIFGVMVAIWVFVRMTSIVGQMKTWGPPFTDYEATTLAGGGLAAALLIVGIVLSVKRPTT